MTTLNIYFGGAEYVAFFNQHDPYNGPTLSQKRHTTVRLTNPKIQFLLDPNRLEIQSVANIKYSDWVSFGGPGCNTPLEDDIIKNSLQFNEEQLISHWINNINQALSIIKSTPLPPRSDSSRNNSRDLEKFRDLGISFDWLSRNFLIGDPFKPINSEKDNVVPTQVNLIGLSRGATSCHMLANAMLSDSDLMNIPLNIFAIDPIVSVSSMPLNQTQLGTNVKEYVAFYARDERTLNYTAVVPTTSEGTAVHIYPMAGAQATLGGNPASDGANGPDKFPEPCDIVTYYAAVCLSRWSQRGDFRGAINQSAVADKLQKVKADYDEYVALRFAGHANASNEVKNEREILLDGKLTNFKSAQGPRFTPNQGLAKGHIEDMSYFNAIT